MTLSITFYDNIIYHRSDFIGRDKDFFGNGVVNLTDFPITYNSNMTLSLGAGTAWVDGFRIANDSNLITVTIPTADTTYSRIDIIQIGHDDLNQTYSLEVKKGVAATTPIEPGADPNYIKLYAINVFANATSISSSNVTDRRSLIPINVDGSQIQYAGAVKKSGDTMTGALTAPSLNAPNIATGFRNLLNPSKQSFSRGSNATGKYLTPYPYNVLRTEQGKFGQGAFIEESTTNLVYNSDFETITGTATVFSDPLTSGTAWTGASGSFTYSASGATSGANASLITAGNSVWKPLTGSNGSALSLTTQATFTTQATLTTNNGVVKLFTDSNNDYEAYIDNGYFRLYKKVAGTLTQLASVAQTISASTTYTMTLSITPSGGLTAKLYSGTGTGGTLLQTLTATDNSLTGGFLIGVGGDTGVVIKSALVTAPFADGWSIGGDQRVAWALTATNPISGSYSVSAIGVAGVQGYVGVTGGITVTAGNTYAISASVNTNNAGSNGAYVQGYMSANTALCKSSVISGTTSTTRYSATATIPSGTTLMYPDLFINDVGTYVVDAIQLEQKAYATTYVRNDSTSATATRQADSLSYTLSNLLPSRYFGALVWKPEQSSSTWSSGGKKFLCKILDINNFGVYEIGWNNTKFYITKSQNNSVILEVDYTISFNALDTIFVAWLDDPTNNTLNLYVGINGGTLATTTGANNTAIGTGQKVFVGCGLNTGAEANGTIDFPIITDIIPTADQVEALYRAGDWGGMRNYPGVMSDSASLGGKAFLRPWVWANNPNTKGVSLDNPFGWGFLNGLSGANIGANAYFDGATGWKKMSQAQVGSYISFGPSGSLTITTSQPGVQDFTTSSVTNIPQILSGGYKIQSVSQQVATLPGSTGVQKIGTFSFPTAFSAGNVPVVIPSINSNLGSINALAIININNQQFDLYGNVTVAGQNFSFSYVAVGQ